MGRFTLVREPPLSIDRILQLKLLVDTGDISKQLSGVTSPSGPLSGAATAIKGWGIAMAADLAISIGQGIVEGIGGGIDAAKEAEVIGTQLENTWKNLDLGSLEELDEITSRLGKRALSLGFDDDTSLAQFRELLQVTGDVEEAQRILEASFDLSRASGDDLETSVTKLRGAFLGQSRALKEFGVEGVSGIEAVDAVWTNFAGGADEHMTTTEGRMERFQGRVDEIFEAIGGVVLGLQQPFLDLMDAADPLLTALAEGIGPAIEDLGTFLGPVVESVGTLIGKMGDLWNALEPVRSMLVDLLMPAFNQIATVITETVSMSLGNLMALFDALTALLNGDVDGAIKAIKTAFDNTFSALVNIVKGPLNAILGALEGALNFLGDAFFGALEEIRKHANNIPFVGDQIPDDPISWGGISVPRLASGGIVSRPTLALIGEAGPEAVVPLSGNSGMGNTYNITVNAAAASPADVGRVIAETLQAYERRSGKGWRS